MSDKLSLYDMLPIITEKLEQGEKVHFTPFGRSMLPLLRDGLDSVTLIKKAEYKKYDICLLKSESGAIALHRIIDNKNGIVALGDNTYKKETGLKSLGAVINIKRGNRDINLNGILYKAYCRFWYFIFPLRKFSFKVKRRIKKLIFNNNK